MTFALTGLREVRVRRLDQREVALDLVELSFRDQYITRSDMWRITCSLVSHTHTHTHTHTLLSTVRACTIADCHIMCCMYNTLLYSLLR